MKTHFPRSRSFQVPPLYGFVLSFLLLTNSLIGQNLHFEFTPLWTYSVNAVSVHSSQLDGTIETRLDSNYVQIDHIQIFNQIQDSFNIKPGFAGILWLHFENSKNWHLKTGWGIYSRRMHYAQGYSNLDTKLLTVSSEKIFRPLSGNSNPDPGSFVCDMVNNIIDPNYYEGTRFNLWYFTLPLEFQLNLWKDRINLSTGINIDFPVNNAIREYVISIEREPVGNLYQCNFIYHEEQSSTTHLRPLLFGTSVSINYNFLSFAGLYLRANKTWSQTLLPENTYTLTSIQKTVKPLQLAIGINLTIPNLMSGKENKTSSTNK